jgi:CDP-diacylglycerol--glycerol-3-phosphate 3-phosphatidyltransferase
MSASRILLVLPLWYCLFHDFPGNRVWALAVIAVGVGTDFLDGYLARRWHQVSEFGKIVDPLADKIGIGSLAVFLMLLGDLPLWYGTFILLRDMLILVGGVSITRQKNIIPQSNWPGKIAVGIVSAVLFFATLGMEELTTFVSILMWLSVAVMLVSLGVYADRLFIGRRAQG